MKESKKFFLATSLLATSICGLNAQMTVTENGQTIFGNRYKTSSTTTPVSDGVMSDASGSAPGTLIGANDPVSVDTLASAVFLGKGANKGNAYITFGTDSRVSVGEAVTNATKPTGVLDLYGQAGTRLLAKGGTVYRFACNTNTGAFSQFRFYTDVAAPSFITTSDYRLKHDVESVGEDYRALWDLNPVSYRLNGSNATSDTP
ncbi:MAG: tail fiber domain-containing protein, partial [Muribaculaceae bacterium]|nr:tail fiber domain-containing protein [Muribaculaceae bacterium]